MSGEWRPGDVAMVTCGPKAYGGHEGGVYRAERTKSGEVAGWRRTSDGLFFGDDEVGHISPLVVIDPEDREQAERLDLTISKVYGEAKAIEVVDSAAMMQAALREFANPTPPRCKAALNIAGEHFQCQLNAPHDTLAHSNSDAEAIWGDPS